MREMYEKLNCPSKDAKLLLAVFQQPVITLCDKAFLWPGCFNPRNKQSLML